ncbi:hypothetical protein LTS18_003647 [Coniosporium uncinatum]|uniref:Uncharacterized protein n=1 Tax=Coniosporium uncinatum TaxID=93489 RepID=A0ACC3DT52_9PEZI|nr:hypothetical protein LTS18_003647 [Coniosporium uncinatum]
MSFVTDQVRRIDGQLDRLQLSQLTTTDEPRDGETVQTKDFHNVRRVEELQALVKTLSTTSYPKNPLLSTKRIQEILRDAKISKSCPICQDISQESEAASPDYIAREAPIAPSEVAYEHELEWLIISKATTQAYGQVVNTLLDQTIPITEDILYWDDIIGSYRYAGLYSIQTSPLRLMAWGKDIFHDVRRRREAFVEDVTQVSVSDRWKRFWGILKQTVRDRSVLDIQRRVVGPLALVRNEARRKQEQLRRTKLLNANALGMLLGEGLSNHVLHEDGFSASHAHQWKSTVATSISLMDVALTSITNPSCSVADFDEHISAATSRDALFKLPPHRAAALSPADAAQRLETLLTRHIPHYKSTLAASVTAHGRPSPLIRYWLPFTGLLLSSGTLLRLLLNRKAQILAGIRDLGATVLDFWANWVVEPTRKVIGTIRHDEGSEVSIMSKRSLEGDRASLERMVVDFARDVPPESGTLTDAELADVQLKVKEGDLTPVLRVYERDLQSPLRGAVTGNLVRALLIQIQKTKVDVEVAMGGIDALLKSQELVFGFVGLTPGVLVLMFTGRWLNSTFGTRKGRALGQQQGELVRELRNIDRVLAAADVTEYGELLYKDHGLLLCEVHVLRQSAQKVLPRNIFRDFLEEIEDLVDVRSGRERQLGVVGRMRWAYARWL